MKYLELCMIVLIAILISACGSEPQENKEPAADIDHSELSGSWQVIAASRDGEPTQTLDNTHFHFSEDSMFTNLPTQELPTSYNWSENQLVRQGTDTTIYNVHTLNNDSLEFSVVLQGSTFTLQLLRLSQTE